MVKKTQSKKKTISVSHKRGITPTQKRKAKRVAISSLATAALLTFFTLFQIATVQISNSDFPTGNIVPNQETDTQSWKSFVDNRYGFSFQYPSESLSVVDDSEQDRAPTPASPEEIIDLQNEFFLSKGYEPPYPLYAIRVENVSKSTDHLVTPFSLWIFENRGLLSADDWYNHFDYYPFAFAPHIPAPVDADRPIQNVVVSNMPGKYHLRVNDQGGETAYVYVQRGPTMFLFVVDLLQEDEAFGNKILSTVRFFPGQQIR